VALFLLVLPAAAPAPADVPPGQAAGSNVPEGLVQGGELLSLTTPVGPGLTSAESPAAGPPLAESVPVAPLTPPAQGEPAIAESVPVVPQGPPTEELPTGAPPGEEPPFEHEGPPREEPHEEPPSEEPIEETNEEPPHGEEPEAEGEPGEGEQVEQPQTALGGAGTIIGTNDAAGWGPAAAATIHSGHITWARVELQNGSTFSIRQALESHFKILAIVGNTNDGTPLANFEPLAWSREVVSQIRAAGAGNIAIAEAGNETYLKGGRPEPVQYGRMYMAAVRAMRAANLRMPLLFNMRGDYLRPSGTWSRDSAGGGWLHDAVVAVPGLREAILHNGVAIHPYGGVGENNHDTYGVAAAAADEAVARRVLGAYPRFYITEFGYDLGACGWNAGACSQPEQASKLRSAYAEFLADPHVDGIWWYQSHDDSTGHWGFMNRDNSTRPSFTALSEAAVQQGQ
jgi:hypothetical protein